MEPLGRQPPKLKPMALLAEYIKAVRTYLPKGAEADDVATELAELLHVEMEKSEQDLGRPLTEVEQQALLAEFGSPLEVANRYGKVNHGLSFGRQLIGPELFPIYLRALAVPFALDLIFAPFLLFSERAVFTHPLQIIIMLLIQVVIVTVIFMGFHTVRGWSHPDAATDARDAWLFPGAYLRPTPRWLSLMGLIVHGLVALWWATAPRTHALVIGDAAVILQPTPAWSQFYWPILALLLASAAHRAVSLVRPDWNWLRPAAVLSVNTFALVLLYPMLRAEPFFQVAATASTSAAAHILVGTLNNYLWWYLLGFGSYWLINVLITARQCSQLLRYRMLRHPR
jgi:hypothetical protein